MTPKQVGGHASQQLAKRPNTNPETREANKSAEARSDDPRAAPTTSQSTQSLLSGKHDLDPAHYDLGKVEDCCALDLARYYEGFEHGEDWEPPTFSDEVERKLKAAQARPPPNSGTISRIDPDDTEGEPQDRSIIAKIAQRVVEVNSDCLLDTFCFRPCPRRVEALARGSKKRRESRFKPQSNKDRDEVLHNVSDWLKRKRCAQAVGSKADNATSGPNVWSVGSIEFSNPEEVAAVVGLHILSSGVSARTPPKHGTAAAEAVLEPLAALAPSKGDAEVKSYAVDVNGKRITAKRIVQEALEQVNGLDEDGTPSKKRRSSGFSKKDPIPASPASPASSSHNIVDVDDYEDDGDDEDDQAAPPDANPPNNTSSTTATDTVWEVVQGYESFKVDQPHQLPLTIILRCVTRGSGTRARAGQTKTLKYGKPIDWSNPSVITKINKWRTQIYERNGQPRERETKGPYNEVEREVMMDAFRFPKADWPQQRELFEMFHHAFPGEFMRVPGSSNLEGEKDRYTNTATGTRPVRTKESLWSAVSTLHERFKTVREKYEKLSAEEAKTAREADRWAVEMKLGAEQVFGIYDQKKIAGVEQAAEVSVREATEEVTTEAAGEGVEKRTREADAEA